MKSVITSVLIAIKAKFATLPSARMKRFLNWWCSMVKWKKHAQLKAGGVYMVRYENGKEIITEAEFDEVYSQEWCFRPLVLKNDVSYAYEWRELTKDEREAISKGTYEKGRGDST